MSKILFSESAWDDYIFWQTQDKKTLKKINLLLKEIQRDNFSGLGKPEPLKEYDGAWSRRIDDCNRIVYKVNQNFIEILQCKGHYDD